MGHPGNVRGTFNASEAFCSFTIFWNELWLIHANIRFQDKLVLTIFIIVGFRAFSSVWVFSQTSRSAVMIKQLSPGLLYFINFLLTVTYSAGKHTGQGTHTHTPHSLTHSQANWESSINLTVIVLRRENIPERNFTTNVQNIQITIALQFETSIQFTQLWRQEPDTACALLPSSGQTMSCKTRRYERLSFHSQSKL